MLEIAKGVYCETGWEGANVSAFKAGDGAVYVDSPLLPRDARLWKKQVSETIKGRAILLINTDYHFDHVMTNSLLCDRVAGHELVEPAFAAQDGEVYAQMAEGFFPELDEKSKKEIRSLKPVSPIITFSENLVLNLGSRRIEVMYVGGHTPATSIIYLPENGILFTGDAHVHDRHPFAGDGNLLQWIKALKRIERMTVSKVVPGHGDVCDLKSVSRLRQFFEELKGQVTELIEQGFGRAEIESRVDLLSFFPVEPGKEARMRAYITLGAGRMFNQLFEASLEASEDT
jgi:cyclase